MPRDAPVTSATWPLSRRSSDIRTPPCRGYEPGKVLDLRDERGVGPRLAGAGNEPLHRGDAALRKCSYGGRFALGGVKELGRLDHAADKPERMRFGSAQSTTCQQHGLGTRRPERVDQTSDAAAGRN